MAKFMSKKLAINTLAKLRLLTHGVKYRHILGYIDIDGWLYTEEAIELYNLSASLPPDHPVVVEIGSWLGKSSLILAKGIKSKRFPKLYCIDPFNADGDGLSKEGYLAYNLRSVSLKERFVKNMERNGVGDVIEILEGYSHDFANNFPEKIDLLFVDGDHAYESVLQDYHDWSPLIKPGGIIAFHDASSESAHEGPWLVVERHVLGNPLWTETKAVDGLVVARKALRGESDGKQ